MTYYDNTIESESEAFTHRYIRKEQKMISSGSLWERGFCVGGEEDIREFARRIDDNNPLHHENAAAQKAGLHGVIAPGVMIIGFVSSTIAARIPGVRIRRLEMEFSNPLYAGTIPSVTCRVERLKKQVAKVGIKVWNGNEILAEGSCVLLLPQQEESSIAA